jgi:Protein of unknown function (DUF3551)
MATAVDYRIWAEECFEWARTAHDERVREQYANLGQIWLECAVRAELRSAVITPRALAAAPAATAPRYYRVAVKLILAIFGILSASAAQAQNAPWCLQPQGEGSLHCTYATFQQCLADRTGNGFCIQNSTYQPSSPSIRRR